MCEDFGCCCYSVFRVLLTFLYIEKLIFAFHFIFKFLGHLVSNFITWALNFFSHWEDKSEYISLTFSLMPTYVWVTFGTEGEVKLSHLGQEDHVDQSLNVQSPRKEVWPWGRWLSSWGNSWRELTAEGCLLETLQATEIINSLFLKED